ncbi:MAG: sulfurtransferase FdhD [Gammaproteobacteria bacterium]|nr:MAG: sulfurtransferase FdhD [Gammaproteobacteria bacterium]
MKRSFKFVCRPSFDGMSINKCLRDFLSVVFSLISFPMRIDRAKITRFRVNSETKYSENDVVAIEEPLQIELLHNNQRQTHSITMRTPGNDEYLAYGLLFAEGVITSADEIESIHLSKIKGDVETSDFEDSRFEANSIEVKLSDSIDLSSKLTPRKMTSYSSCGICGKTSLKALALKNPREQRKLHSEINPKQVLAVRKTLAKQSLFGGTGGSHVAGVVYESEVDTESKVKRHHQLDFDKAICFEDVGRHNALDKLIGSELLHNNLSKAGVVILSGRVGFELVQKVVMAGFSTIIALGAPSDLSIKTANQFGVTLIGFAKDEQYNLYTF